MKRTLLLATMILGLNSGSALADGSYLSGNVGLAVYHDSKTSINGGMSNLEYSMGSGVDIALGYAFNQNIRIEAEYGYRAADWRKMDGSSIADWSGAPDLTVGTDIMSYMVNGYCDIPQLDFPVTLFLGAGAGIINGEVSYPVAGGGTVSKDDAVIGYQVMIGGSYPINKKVSLNAGYKYQMAVSDLKGNLNGNAVDLPYKSSIIFLGARYNF